MKQKRRNAISVASLLMISVWLEKMSWYHLISFQRPHSTSVQATNTPTAYCSDRADQRNSVYIATGNVVILAFSVVAPEAGLKAWNAEETHADSGYSWKPFQASACTPRPFSVLLFCDRGLSELLLWPVCLKVYSHREGMHSSVCWEEAEREKWKLPVLCEACSFNDMPVRWRLLSAATAFLQSLSHYPLPSGLMLLPFPCPFSTFTCLPSFLLFWRMCLYWKYSFCLPAGKWGSFLLFCHSWLVPLHSLYG